MADSNLEPDGIPATAEGDVFDGTLWSRMTGAETPERFAVAWLEMQAQILGDVAGGVVVLGTPGTGPFAPIAHWPAGAEIGVNVSMTAELALSKKQGVVRDIASQEDDAVERHSIAYPIVVDDQISGVAAFEVEGKSQDDLRRAMRQLQWGTAWLENLIRRRSVTPRDRLIMVLELISSSFEQERFQAAAIAVVTEIAIALRCEWVAYASLRGKHAVVRALSHSAEVGQSSNLVRAIGAAMNEALDQHDVVVYPQLEKGDPQVTRAHQRLAEEVGGAGEFCTIPLSVHGRLCGAITLMLSAERGFTVDDVETCKHLGAIIGPVLETKRREDRWLIEKAWESFTKYASRLIGPRHMSLKLVVSLVVAAGLFLATAEGDYLIKADATLEGTVQRAVTALIDGYIAETELRAGDTVTKGQVLGRLEDKDLKLELLRWNGQYQQRILEYRKEQAANNRAQARILKTQIEQAAARIDFLEQQLERVEIIAPFDGIIIAGDLSQMLGAPVERGQILFEVAPLNSYRVIMKVDEREISRVAVDQVGQLALAGLSDVTLDFRVEKITPISIGEEGRNFFRVEGRLESAPDQLRPGMEGVGKIFVERRMLVWIWTHDMFQWMRFQLWIWWPSLDRT